MLLCIEALVTMLRTAVIAGKTQKEMVTSRILENLATLSNILGYINGVSKWLQICVKTVGKEFCLLLS